MKKGFILLIMSVLLAMTNNATGQWTSYLTNNSDTDYINAIVAEGNTIWAATNGGVVKWNSLTGANTIFPLDYIPNYGRSISCAAIDWNGEKWFGGVGRIYNYNDSTWFSLTADRDSLLNGSVRSIAVDSVNKRIIFVLFKQFSELGGTVVLLSWAYGGKLEKLYSDKVSSFFPPLFSIVVDTVNPWNILGTSSAVFTSFGKTDQGYVVSGSGGVSLYTTSIALDRDGNIWVTASGDSGIIAFFDRYKNELVSYSSEITGTIGSPKKVVIDHNWVKWFGSAGSLVRYNDKTWSAYPFQKISEFDQLTALSVDERGDVWIGRGYSSGPSYGLWRFHPPVTGVNEEGTLPQSLKINGNSPNPFNPSTSISFSLSAPGKTELVVYSATGQLVRTLISGNQKSGTHSLVWDGRDNSGKDVSSGVYFSRLTSGNQIATGKMLLLR